MAKNPGGSSGQTGWGVYILACRDGSLYTGATNDLERRLGQHQAGTGARYTRSRRPLRLVYWEECPDRSAALRREIAIKRLSRAGKLSLLEAWPAAVAGAFPPAMPPEEPAGGMVAEGPASESGPTCGRSRKRSADRPAGRGSGRSCGRRTRS